MAPPRNAVWLRRCGRGRVPAHRHPELDGALADRRQTPARLVRPLGGGSICGPLLRGCRFLDGRHPRCRLLPFPGVPGGARGACQQEPQHADRRHRLRLRSDGRCRLCGGCRSPLRRNRLARSDRAGDHHDFTDRRPDHSVVHAQLDGEEGPVGDAPDPAAEPRSAGDRGNRGRDALLAGAFRTTG